MELREEILSEMSSVRTVDCHSHTCLRREYYREVPKDLFGLGFSYFGREVEAAGVKLEGTDEEKWEGLKAVILHAGNTSYWRHLTVVYRELFGMEGEELTDSNWRAVNEEIRRRTVDPGWYDHVTKELCNLETQVRNVPWFEDWEPEYFTAVLRMEPALELHEEETRRRLEEHLGREFGDLSTLKRGLADLAEEYKKRGAVGIKLAHAYGRTLASEPVPEEEAGKIFRRALKGEELSPAEIKAFQDHIVFFLADMAGEMELVFQIHTGVQTTWGHIPDSDPLLLIPLIRSHPHVKFDLFHAGYPYSRELGMLGKHYPNVWLNMCWMYVISTSASRQVLREWLDLVPLERILGFGSDVGFPEFVYGHLVMARSVLSEVLEEKVRVDFWSEELALDAARKLMRDNAMALYGLSALR